MGVIGLIKSRIIYIHKHGHNSYFLTKDKDISRANIVPGIYFRETE